MLLQSRPGVRAGRERTGSGTITTLRGSRGRGGRHAVSNDTQTAARPPRSWLVAAATPIAIGLFLALRDAWVCDDAFISFRYVDHLEHGLGLVYNSGERVEGYTHFLWVILLAAMHRTGIDLVTLGRYLPLVFHAGTLALLWVWSFQRATSARLFLPLAAWGVALHRDLQIWASGGLETAAFTFCVTAAVLAASSPGVDAGVLATLAALATLFRPEGILLSVCVAGLLLWRRPGAGALGRFAAVWLALVVPLVGWRLLYYHDWLPNTFYAKSAASANWYQGFRYVWLYFATYPVLIPALGIAIAGGWAGRRRAGDPMLPVALVSVAFLLYVLRVGGDFMFARFLLPITPLLFVALEEALRRRWPAVGILGAVIVLAATAAAPPWRQHLLADPKRAGGIVDEHRFYPRSFVAARRREGEDLAAIFRGTDVRICILGSDASLAYFARFPYAFERYGLTDREFARRPIHERGRPGHERQVLRKDLLDRRVHFFFRGEAEDRTGAIDEAIFGGLLASVVFYDSALMNSLRGRPQVEFVDFPAYLDSLIPHAHEMAPEARRRAWVFSEGYYFAHNADPVREARVAKALGEGQGEPEGR